MIEVKCSIFYFQRQYQCNNFIIFSFLNNRLTEFKSIVVIISYR